MKAESFDIFVTVGFAGDFSRLVEKMDEIAAGRKDWHVVMQIGETVHEPQNTEFFRFSSDLTENITNADLVVSHGGMTVIEVVRSAKPVVVVPRQAHYGEHLNDHQSEWVKAFEKRPGIAIVHDVENLETAILRVSENRPVQGFDDTNRLRLVERLRQFVQAEKSRSMRKTEKSSDGQ